MSGASAAGAAAIHGLDLGFVGANINNGLPAAPFSGPSQHQQQSFGHRIALRCARCVCRVRVVCVLCGFLKIEEGQCRDQRCTQAWRQYFNGGGGKQEEGEAGEE